MSRRFTVPSFVIAGLMLSAAWTPRFEDEDWVQQIFVHRCDEIDLSIAESLELACARDGSVASLEGPVDIGFAARFRATEIWRRGPREEGNGVAVFIAGEYVIVERVTCGRCRRVMGHGWVFRPMHASARVLRSAQSAAGLPGVPPLRTVAAWRSARP